MKKSINTSKGLYQASDSLTTPDGYYRDAENMRPEGLTHVNLSGNEYLRYINGTVFGTCSIGDSVFILRQESNRFSIWRKNPDDSFTKVFDRYNTAMFDESNPEEVQVEGRNNWAGEPIIYFNSPNHGARRMNVSENYYEGLEGFYIITALFIDYELPKTTMTGELMGGNLNAGSYQLFSRLVTETGASTPFGPNSGVISITSSNYNGSFYDIAGDAPDTPTGKAISVRVDNINKGFKYVQLGVLTYTGIDNQPKVTISNNIPVTGESIVYTYRGGLDDADSITLNELVSDGVAYTGGEFFAQKDSSLLIGNPKEYDLPDINWYSIAYKARVTYKIKELPYNDPSYTFEGEPLKFEYPYGRFPVVARPGSESENDHYWIETSGFSGSSGNIGYADPLNCTLYRGYRRGENYALQLTPVFKNGIKGPTVHIPAENGSTTPSPGGGVLGTQVTTATYPDNRYSPIQKGWGVRHHKMPTADVEPVIRKSGGKIYIRVIGLSIDLNLSTAESALLENEIQGMIISRGDRRTDPTMVSQGMVRLNTTYRFNLQTETDITILPGSGKMRWLQDTKSGGDETNYSSQTSLYDNFNVVVPDFIHNTHDPNNTTHIKAESLWRCSPYLMPDYFYFTHQSHLNRTRGMFVDMGSPTTSPNMPSTTTQVAIDTALNIKAFGVPNESNQNGGTHNSVFVSGSSSLRLCSTQGFVWLQTSGNVPYMKPWVDILPPGQDQSSPYWAQEFVYARGDDGNNISGHIYTSNPDSYWGVGAGAPELDDPEIYFDTNKEAHCLLHQLTRVSQKQYGEIDQMVGMFVHYEEWTSDSFDFFGGDTFISKYGLQCSDEAAHMYGNGSENAGFNAPRPPAQGAIYYMWIESDNNYNYRYYDNEYSYSTAVTDQGNASGEGSFPYYPAYKVVVNGGGLGLLSARGENWIWPGHANLYNNQYSTQPTTTPYIDTDIDYFEKRPSLTNRIIYSDTSIQGEREDAYQVFLPNNYYDLPEERGDMTDLYVNRELFASTEETQWQLYFNTLATQATSAGEVVLGTGGAFNRPAVPLTTTDGGFGGTAHWKHSTATPWGRMFVDHNQGLIFYSGSGKLNDITSPMGREFQRTIRALDLGDIQVHSEPKYSHAIFRLGDVGYAYDIERTVFTSRHTYPTTATHFTHGPDLYTVDTGAHYEGRSYVTSRFYKHSVEDTTKMGQFYGETYPSSITVTANPNPAVSKLFETIELKTLSEINTAAGGVFRDLNQTFESIKVFNEYRNSGTVAIKHDDSLFAKAGPLEVLTRRVKDGYRLGVPRDQVIDPTYQTDSESNHREKTGDTVKAKWLPRMRGNYIDIKLNIDNSKGKLTLFDVSLGISENIR